MNTKKKNIKKNNTNNSVNNKSKNKNKHSNANNHIISRGRRCLTDTKKGRPSSNVVEFVYANDLAKETKTQAHIQLHHKTTEKKHHTTTCTL